MRLDIRHLRLYMAQAAMCLLYFSSLLLTYTSLFLHYIVINIFLIKTLLIKSLVQQTKKLTNYIRLPQPIQSGRNL